MTERDILEAIRDEVREAARVYAPGVSEIMRDTIAARAATRCAFRLRALHQPHHDADSKAHQYSDEAEGVV